MIYCGWKLNFTLLYSGDSLVTSNKMAQPSVASYFNTRKRPAIDEYKINHVKKVLVLDDTSTYKEKIINPPLPSKVSSTLTAKKNDIIGVSARTEKILESCARKVLVASKPASRTRKNGNQDIQKLLDNMGRSERCVTPPAQPLNNTNEELNVIKKKICKSSKLADLKASISRFNASSAKLQEAEQRTASVTQSPKIKSFKSIEFEVTLR